MHVFSQNYIFLDNVNGLHEYSTRYYFSSKIILNTKYAIKPYNNLIFCARSKDKQLRFLVEPTNSLVQA